MTISLLVSKTLAKPIELARGLIAFGAGTDGTDDGATAIVLIDDGFAVGCEVMTDVIDGGF